MTASVSLVCNSLILVNTTLFGGFTLSRLLESHKNPKQIFALLANIFGTLDFNLWALDRFHFLGPTGLDPTLGFFLDIICGPMIYLFFISESDSQYRFQWKHAIGILLVLILTVIHLGFRIVYPGEVIFSSEKAAIGYAMYAWFVFFQVLFLVRTGYGVLVKKDKLTRIVLFNTCLASTWTVFGLLEIAILRSPYRIVATTVGTIFFLVLVIIYPIKVGVPLTRENLQAQKRYQKSKIVGVDIPRTIAKLDDLMHKDKLFRQEDLSLSDLAERVDLTPHQLSEFLNKVLDATFSQYINGWRLSEVQRQLISEPEKSVLDIAFYSGFGSKSAFNSFFFRATGLTPKEYREQGRVVDDC